MGFINRESNRKALIKTNNDISEAVTILTSYNYFDDDDDDDDIYIPAETTFIGPLTKEQVEQQEKVRRKKENATKIRKEKEKENKYFILSFTIFTFVV